MPPLTRTEIKVGAKITKKLFTIRYGKHGRRVLADWLDEVETKDGTEYRLKKPLPTPEEYAKLRDAKYTTTLSALVSDAYSEATSLRDELQDWYDNLPESFQSGDKGSALEAATDALGGFCDDEPEIPEAFEKQTLVFLPGETSSRADRAAEAARMLREAVDWLESWEAIVGGGKVASEDLRQEVESLKDTLNSAIDELEAVEFPGMY